MQPRMTQPQKVRRVSSTAGLCEGDHSWMLVMLATAWLRERRSSSLMAMKMRRRQGGEGRLR